MAVPIVIRQKIIITCLGGKKYLVLIRGKYINYIKIKQVLNNNPMPNPIKPIECNHAHCRCMNMGGLCPRRHYAECIKNEVDIPNPTKTNSEQEEEIRLLSSCLVDEMVEERYALGKHHPPEDVPQWFVNQIKSIIFQQQFVLLERVQKLIKSKYSYTRDLPSTYQNLALDDLLQSLDSLTDKK